MRCNLILGVLTAASAAPAGSMPTAQEPLLGPSFLSNFDPTGSQYIRNASDSFPNKIEALFENGALNKTDLELVFAVDVFSAATNKSIYTYHHVGEDGKPGLTAGELNDQTIGRTGSVSKLFTAYALLASAGIEIFSHPVTRYIPELLGNSSGDPLNHIRWEDITVGALASHQAGTGGATGFLEEFLGTSTDPELIDKITPQDFFAYLRDSKHPTSSAFRNALYSDAGYCLLGQVLARATGKSYGEALQDSILKPLGMNGTSVAAPQGPDVNAYNRSIISAESNWGNDIPFAQASGGVYSSTADLRALGLSILNSEILSAAMTSQWMKPLSGTGNLVELIGAPWEIARLAIPTTPGSTSTRVSDLYIKAGGNIDYTCILALSPDHGIGYSILIGGQSANNARWPIRDLVGELFIPAAEAAAAENAEQNLAGFFAASEGGSSSNITLTVEDGFAGVGLESIYIDGEPPLGFAPPTENGTASWQRLYPTGLYSNSRSLSALYNTIGTFRTSFRAVAPKLAPRAASEGGTGGLFSNQFPWADVGFFDTFDEFIFTIEDGRLMNVSYAGGPVTFSRVE